MTRAVVTGGLGFIGSHVVDRLLADGWDVTVVDDSRTAHYTATELWNGVRLVGAPVQAVEYREVRDCDAVFHLASPVGPVGVLRQGGKLTREVIETSSAVAEWSRVLDVPMVFVSTSEVYGGGDDGRCAEHMDRVVPAEQSDRLEYQTAKIAAEVMLLNEADVRVVRPFNVAGPRQSARGGFVLPRFVWQALTGQPLTVYGDGTARRALSHVVDVADGVVASLSGKSGSVFNVGNPANKTSIARLAQMVTEEIPGTVLYVDPKSLHGDRFVEVGDKFPDPTLAMTELGWEPTRSLRQVVSDTIDRWDDRLAP